MAVRAADEASSPNRDNDGTRLAITPEKPTASTIPPRMIGVPVSTIARRIAHSSVVPSRRCRLIAANTCTVSSTERPRQTLNTITLAGSSEPPAAVSTAATAASGKRFGRRLTTPARLERNATAMIVLITKTSRVRLDARSLISCRMLRAETTGTPTRSNLQPGRPSRIVASPVSMRSKTVSSCRDPSSRTRVRTAADRLGRSTNSSRRSARS